MVEAKAPLALPAPEADLAPPVLKELMVLTARLAPQAQRVRQVPLDQTDRSAPPVLPVLPVLPVPQAQTALQAPLVLSAPLAPVVAVVWLFSLSS